MPYSKQCPYCGEPLRLNETAKTARCDRCESDFAPEELRIQSEEELLRLVSEPPKETTDCGGFLCENCGAQMIADETIVSAFCCYCGAPATVPIPVEGAVEPDQILPFAVDRQEAIDRFVHWFDRKKLIPTGLLDTVKSGKISGVYVPFWLFDCEMETRLYAGSTATETVRTEKNEVVTAKDFYHYRSVKTAYANVPADASERMDGRLMNLLGPFDLAELKPFDPALIKGFYSEKNSLTAEQVFGRVREQLEADSRRAAQETLNEKSSVKITSVRHVYRSLNTKYALLPVWIVTYPYRGFTHQFFMNGQTGKIVGEAPLSLTSAFQWFGGVAAAVSVVGEIAWVLLRRLL